MENFLLLLLLQNGIIYVTKLQTIHVKVLKVKKKRERDLDCSFDKGTWDSIISENGIYIMETIVKFALVKMACVGTAKKQNVLYWSL